MKKNVFLGVDLGGSKIECVAFDQDFLPLSKMRLDAPKNEYKETLKSIQRLITKTENKTGRSVSIGIGAPGTISSDSGRIINAPSTPIQGQFFLEDVQNLIEREVTIANDADCFVLSEAIDGAAAGFPIVFGAILGTGVGGGIAINGQLLRGCNGIMGEWGHAGFPIVSKEKNFLVNLPKCPCGEYGHIESWLSGRSFEKIYQERTGILIAAPVIIEKMRHGEFIAESCFLEYIERLAQAFGSIINILDPHIIVLGGGMSNVDEIYAQVPERWCQYVYSDKVNTILAKPLHGDSSGVRGAAWLGKQMQNIK